jgi:hypothetical protein
LARSILFIDGAKYAADSAGAYWLLDEFALAQRELHGTGWLPRPPEPSGRERPGHVARFLTPLTAPR